MVLSPVCVFDQGMNTQELTIFYTAQSNREFDLITGKEKEFDVLDFAARLWAGKILYELDLVRRKYREWN